MDYNHSSRFCFFIAYLFKIILFKSLDLVIMLRYYSNIKLLHILSAVVQHILLRQMHLLLPSSVLCIAAKSSCKLRVMKLKKTYLVEAVKHLAVSFSVSLKFLRCYV